MCSMTVPLIQAKRLALSDSLPLGLGVEHAMQALMQAIQAACMVCETMIVYMYD